MRLYINGADINRLILADLDSGGAQRFDVQPEEFLKTLDSFLKEKEVHPKDVDELYVVVGPGSATALRVTLSIVNTMKFIYQIPTFSISKNVDEQDSDTLESIMNKKVVHVKQPAFLEPIYEHEPRITESKKDSLGRKK